MSLNISCVITSYNNGPWLRQSVESVLNQTYPINEIIIADDASTDGSRDLIFSLAREYPRIKTVFREKNIGVAANRDLAIREATGNFVTTLDGDDFFYPEKLQHEAGTISRLPAGSIVYSNFNRIDSEENILKAVQLDDFGSLTREEIIAYLFLRGGVLPRDMLLPKSVFLKAGGYRESLRMYEDWDIKLRLARDAGKWALSGIIGVAHRHHGAGLSNLDSLTHLKYSLDVIFFNRSWIEPLLGSATIKRAIAQTVQFYLK